VQDGGLVMLMRRRTALILHGTARHRRGRTTWMEHVYKPTRPSNCPPEITPNKPDCFVQMVPVSIDRVEQMHRDGEIKTTKKHRPRRRRPATADCEGKRRSPGGTRRGELSLTRRRILWYSSVLHSFT